MYVCIRYNGYILGIHIKCCNNCMYCIHIVHAFGILNISKQRIQSHVGCTRVMQAARESYRLHESHAGCTRVMPVARESCQLHESHASCTRVMPVARESCQLMMPENFAACRSQSRPSRLVALPCPALPCPALPCHVD